MSGCGKVIFKGRTKAETTVCGRGVICEDCHAKEQVDGSLADLKAGRYKLLAPKYEEVLLNEQLIRTKRKLERDYEADLERIRKEVAKELDKVFSTKMWGNCRKAYFTKMVVDKIVREKNG